MFLLPAPSCIITVNYNHSPVVLRSRFILPAEAAYLSFSLPDKAGCQSSFNFCSRYFSAVSTVTAALYCTGGSLWRKSAEGDVLHFTV
jgi:hypothetical protein